MADSATVCGCVGVTKGAIIEAIHEQGVNTLSQLKERPAPAPAAAAARSLCQDLLKAVAPEFEERRPEGALRVRAVLRRRTCASILRSQKLQLGAGGARDLRQRPGCEVCKPALSYMLDMLWCGDHDEDRSARFINDRVHANIQKDGTFSVVPRIRGGVTTPDELRRIADVADKYKVPMVKITGSQRIDLLGIKKSDLPKVWADLGMPSGQAYTKGVRMVKTCVGTEFCRFGTQDSTAAGIEMERRFENLFTPHKVKMAAVGCPRNCAEATVKDIGLVGQEGGWQVVVGGAAGKSVRKADLLDHRRDHGGGARGGRAVLPVLPRERQLPGAHLRLRRARRDRQGPQGNGLRDRRRQGRAARPPAKVEGAVARRVAGRADAGAIRRSSSRSADRDRVLDVSRRADGYVSRRWRTSRAREGRAVHGRRSRDRDLQSRRSPSRGRQPLPAPGRPALRRHRHRRVGRVSAARLEDQSARPAAVERPARQGRCVETYPTRVEEGVVVVEVPLARAGWSGSMIASRRVSAQPGTLPTLVAALLYFDVSFMAWVLLGPLGAVPARGARAHGDAAGACSSPFRCSAAHSSGRCSACSADAIGGRRTGLIGLALTLVPLVMGWQWAHTTDPLLRARAAARASPAPASRWRCRWRAAGIRRSIRGWRWASPAPAIQGTLLATLFAPRLAERFGWHDDVRPAMLPIALVLRSCSRCSRGTARRSRRPRHWRDYAAVLQRARHAVVLAALRADVRRLRRASPAS